MTFLPIENKDEYIKPARHTNIKHIDLFTLSEKVNKKTKLNREFLPGGEADWAKFRFDRNVVAQRCRSDIIY